MKFHSWLYLSIILYLVTKGMWLSRDIGKILKLAPLSIKSIFRNSISWKKWQNLEFVWHIWHQKCYWSLPSANFCSHLSVYHQKWCFATFGMEISEILDISHKIFFFLFLYKKYSIIALLTIIMLYPSAKTS